MIKNLTIEKAYQYYLSESKKPKIPQILNFNILNFFKKTKNPKKIKS